ncbi:MAG: P-protein, partial [Planctomycetota bacterium]
MPAARSRPATGSGAGVEKTAVAKKPLAAAPAPRPRPPAVSVAAAAGEAGIPPEIEISRLDEQLVGLLNRRVALYLEKMKGVQTPSRAVFSDLDQQQVWGLIDRVGQGPLTTTELRTIFRPLLSAGRQRIKQTRVAYLGPPFSFTHQAAISRFGESADLVPVSTIATVFEEVNRGHVDFGIVPI